MEKMKKVLQKQKGVGKHSRRIACLLLALVLTITGLPMSGVQEVKASDYTVSLGGDVVADFSYQWFPGIGGGYLVTLSGTGVADGTQITENGYSNLRSEIVKIVIGEGITGLENYSFEYSYSLREIEFQGGPVTIGEGAFDWSGNIKKLVVPASWTAENIASVKTAMNESVRTQVLVEKKHTLYVMSGTIQGVEPDEVSGVCKKEYYTSDTVQTATATITPNKYSSGSTGLTFQNWKICDVTGEAIASVTCTLNANSYELSISHDAPAEIYVTAQYDGLSGKHISVEMSDKMMCQIIEGYGKQKANSKTAPDANTVKIELGYAVGRVKNSEIGQYIYIKENNWSVTAVTRTALFASTTTTAGTAKYDVAYVVFDDASTKSATTSFTIQLQKKPNKNYTVTVVNGKVTSGGSVIESDSTGEWKKSFSLTEIEKAPSQQITLTIAPVTRTGLTFVSWICEPKNVWNNNSSNSATLILDENSPQNIRISAKYNATGQYSFDELFSYMQRQLNACLQDKGAGVLSVAMAPTGSALQDALTARLKSAACDGNILVASDCTCTVVSAASLEATRDAEGYVKYNVEMTLKKNDENLKDNETRSAILSLSIPQKTPLSEILPKMQKTMEAYASNNELDTIPANYSGIENELSRICTNNTSSELKFELSDFRQSGTIIQPNNSRQGQIPFQYQLKVTDLKDNNKVHSATYSLNMYVKKTNTPVTPPSPDQGGGSDPSTIGPIVNPDPDKEKEEEKDTDKDKEEEKEPEKPAPTQTVTKKSNSYQVTTKKTTATVSVKDLKKHIAQNKNSKLVLKCGNSTATFDKTAVQSILAQAKKIGSSELKFVCKTGANSSLNSAQKKALKKKTVVGCYHVYLKCGDKLIKDFGKGKVTIKVPLKLKSGQKSKYVKLYYINSKGKLTKMTSSLAGSQLSYQTTHFSFFTALYAKPVTSTKETSTTTDTDKSQNTQTDKDTTGEKDTTTEKDTTGDKDTSTDQNEQAEKPSQEIGTENETLSGSSDLEERESLSKADSGEITAFCLLQLQPTRTNDTEIRLGWNTFPAADGYDLFGARCNTKTTRYELEQIASLDAPTMTSWMCENLKENTYYKFLVRAYKKVDGKKQYITRSTLIHVPTTGGRYDQIEGVSVKASEVKLSVGKTHAIKASLEVEKQKVRSHTIISYESTDPTVASVDENGRIKAKKKGTCTIYVYAQNGLYTTVQVTVK